MTLTHARVPGELTLHARHTLVVQEILPLRSCAACACIDAQPSYLQLQEFAMKLRNCLLLQAAPPAAAATAADDSLVSVLQCLLF